MSCSPPLNRELLPLWTKFLIPLNKEVQFQHASVCQQMLCCHGFALEKRAPDSSAPLVHVLDSPPVQPKLVQCHVEDAAYLNHVLEVSPIKAGPIPVRCVCVCVCVCVFVMMFKWFHAGREGHTGKDPTCVKIQGSSPPPSSQSWSKNKMSLCWSGFKVPRQAIATHKIQRSTIQRNMLSQPVQPFSKQIVSLVRQHLPYPPVF